MKWQKIDGKTFPKQVAKWPNTTPVLLIVDDVTGRNWVKGTFIKNDAENYHSFRGDGMNGDWNFTHFAEVELPTE